MALLCRFLGHRWRHPQHVNAPTFYTCTRCHEPGFWVAT